MEKAKQKKLSDAGWTVGSASDFLGLSPEEEFLVGIKRTLAAKVKKLRTKSRLTQTQLADRIKSSQSRIAKLEVADKSVALELYFRSLVSLGASRQEIGSTISDEQREAEFV